MFDKKILKNCINKYKFDDPWDVVDFFEKKIAAFFGSKFAVSTDCCSHAIFLCLKLINEPKKTIYLPENTYISVAVSVNLAGYKFKFKKISWKNLYQLEPFNIFDSATNFKKNSYINNSLMCLSFHHRKHLPIGKGGMILTNSKRKYNALKLMRYDGRNNRIPYSKDKIKKIGYHMYMTPEQAAYGLFLFDKLKNKPFKDTSDLDYSSLKNIEKIIR